MDKPIKPKKPCSRDPVPQKIIDWVSWVTTNKSGDIVLIPENDSAIDKEHNYIDYAEMDNRGLTVIDSNDKLSYSLLTKIFYIVCEDFKFWIQSQDEYLFGLCISHKVKNENYELEKNAYDNRVENYERDLLKYEEDMVKYQKFKSEERVKRLKNEIRELKKEIKSA